MLIPSCFLNIKLAKEIKNLYCIQTVISMSDIFFVLIVLLRL